MKIIFLGTNGWYSSQTGDTPCILIDSKDQYIIFDAGNGIYKLDNYIKEEKPISIFISHFHIDHVSGLHTLSKFDFKQGIDVYIGEGRTKDFDILFNPPYTVGYKPRPENINVVNTEIRLHELGSEGNLIPFKMQAIKQFHGYIDHGYRIELEGKVIAYTGDCGFTDAVLELAKDADLLICECTNKKTVMNDQWGHFDPEQAGNLAKQAKVKQMILTHFGPTSYPTIEDRSWAEKVTKEIFPQTVAAKDGFEFNL